MDYENIQFLLRYTDIIHSEYFDFLNIFLLIIPLCIPAAACVNHINISGNIILRLFFFIEKIFLPKKN